VAVDLERQGGAPDQSPRRCANLVQIRDARHHHHEFVAADASDGIALALGADQQLGHLLQQRIARLVAEAVIDVLEAVEIDIEKDDLLARTSSVQRLLDPLVKERAIGQAGEAVVQREPLGPLARFDLLGRVACRAAIADEVALTVIGGLTGQPVDPLAPMGIHELGVDVAKRGARGDLGIMSAPVGQAARRLQELRVGKAEHLGHRVPRRFGEAVGDVGQAETGIGFPYPVGGGLGDVPETRLAGMYCLFELFALGNIGGQSDEPLTPIDPKLAPNVRNPDLLAVGPLEPEFEIVRDIVVDRRRDRQAHRSPVVTVDERDEGVDRADLRLRAHPRRRRSDARPWSRYRAPMRKPGWRAMPARRAPRSRAALVRPP
jgi:hypothetical protein